MGGHHKKNLRAEKAKVKLKGAQLQKGLNVTKTDFKVRKIVIREKFQEAQYNKGRRQINLKEILSKLKHHNSAYRSESLKHLKEAIMSGHSDILGQLNTIMQSVASLCLDVEKDVRRECFKSMSCLLAVLDESTVSPFFHIISTYLRCAMTHIQPAIQEDALNLLDVLLEHVPNLIAAQSDKIFRNFLEMISRVRTEGGRTGRVLTTHMGQNQTSIKWRSKVLIRLQNMLQTLAKKKQAHSAKANTATQCRTITFNNKAPQHYNVLREHKKDAIDMQEIFNRSISTGNNDSTGSNSDQSNIIRGYVEHLMPLLVESWIEVRPQDTNTNTQTLLTYDTANTLLIIMEIIKNLWILVDQHQLEINSHDLSIWYCKEYGEVFTSSFLYSSFPYQKKEDASKHGNKNGKKLASTETSSFCVQQNLVLSYLLCRFIGNTAQQHIEHFTVILHYLMTMVNNVNKLQSEQDQHHLLLALSAYLLDNGHKFLEHHADDTKALLRITIKAFLQNRFSNTSAGILIMLCEIVQSTYLFNAFGPTEFSELLEYLPRLLLNTSITENALLAMSSLARKKNSVFLKSLVLLMPNVIENISKIQIIGAPSTFDGKKHIMNLFFWTDRQWQGSEFVEKVQQHVSDKRVVSYFKFILLN